MWLHCRHLCAYSLTAPLSFLLDLFATTVATAGISRGSVDGVNRMSNVVIHQKSEQASVQQRATREPPTAHLIDHPLLRTLRTRLSILENLAAGRLLHVVVPFHLSDLLLTSPTPARKTLRCSFRRETASAGQPTIPPERPSNLLSVYAEGVPVEALVDTGAAISIIRADFCSRLRKVMTPYCGPSLRAATNAVLRPIAQCTVRVFIDGIRHHIVFAVFPECSHEVILGWDFLSSASAAISCRERLVHLNATGYSLPDYEERMRLVTSSDYVLWPSREEIISVNSSDIRDGDVLILPYGHTLSRGILITPGLVRFSHGSAFLTAVNQTTEPRLLPRGSSVTCAVDTQPNAVVALSPVRPESTSSPPTASSTTLSATISPDLTAAQSHALLALLEKHRSLFDVNSPALGMTAAATHRIHTDGSRIVHRRPYRVSHREREIIEENVSDMLRRNIIRPSSSPWSSPVVLVQKKDGSVRFCVDYRALNKITRKDVYPLPRIDDALDSLQGAEYFSSIDLRSGYWQIPVSESDKEKTAFATPDGLYEFNVMPFGLCNAPATFERMVDNVLRGLKWKTCLCYLDDIVVFSATFPEHLQRLEQVLTCLANAGLQLNTKKCTFAGKSIKVLGHLVSKEGIRPDPEKLSAVLEFPRPLRQKTYAVFSDWLRTSDASYATSLHLRLRSINSFQVTRPSLGPPNVKVPF